MTSANAAVKRLKSESLQQKALNELKQDAAELGLSKEDVKKFGNLTHKQTWLDAIGEALAREFDAVAEPEPNKANSEDEPNWDALEKNDVVLGETVETVEPEIKPDIPHWLNGRNAAEAKALIDLGFWCVGSVDNWGEPEQSKIIETSGDWSFNYDYIGMFIEARCNGAVFNIDVEETNEEQDKELVNKAVATIKKADEDWGLQFGQQLTIFDCEQSQNREQENIDDSEEPPEPDDYGTGEEEGGANEMIATEIACLIDHPALAEGELREPADGGFYIGKDERGLPLQFGFVNSEDDSLAVYTLKPSAPIPPLIVENCDRQIFNKTYGIYRNLPIFPIRDELLEQMEKYVGDCISPQEFEQLKIEPLDEYTAAIYLGWLEESERMAQEAIAA